MHVPGSLAPHNQDDQNKVQPAYKFCFQLTFQFLDAINLYVDQLFQQLHHLALKLILKHHEQQDVEVQNLNLNF